MIVATFTIRGVDYIVNEVGEIYRVEHEGKYSPTLWTYHYVTQLM